MPKRTAPLALLVATLLVLGWLCLRTAPTPASSSIASPAPRAPESSSLAAAPATVPATPADFARLVPAEITPAILSAAAQRRDTVLDLMREDPARALAESISWSEHAALPEALRPYFEKPFNTLATLEVLPDCTGATPAPSRRLLLDGRAYTAAVYGERLAQSSKTAAPLSGITLGDQAVVADEVLRVLSAEDRQTLAALPLANPDPARDFATGRPLASEPVVALAGGQRFLFNSPADVAKFNTRLAAFDARPSPHGGARALFALPYPADASAGFDWPAAESWSIELASAWTESPKNVFFIRVDFSDRVGESVSQAALANVLNTSVDESIAAMSYGKTSITAAVSSTVLRLPSPTTTYLPSNNDLLYNDAVAAYLALAGATALNGYDIVGVHFASIGMKGNNLTYAGLASLGGTRQWLQGTTSTTVIVHEFGHNYGLNHANLWATTDGSVVGTGASVEYGDLFDIMGDGSAPDAHFHPQGKSLLNWLSSTQWTDATVAGSGLRRVHRFDSASTASGSVPRGLRILKGGTNNTAAAEYYWLGYRPGITANPWLQRGGYLIWERPNTNQGWLLDTTPGSAYDEEDSALRLGRTYSDTAAGVHLTPVALGGSGPDAWLDVNVQLGAFPGNTAPSATFSPTTTFSARTTQTFTVTASDPNGDTLAYAWDFGDGDSPDNASSLPHSWTVGGNYSVSVTVSDMKGGVVTRSASVTVTDPLDAWTSSTLVAGRTITDIAYLDGRFIAGGNNYAYFSLDGLTWSASYLSLNHRTGGLATDGNAFVLAGYDWNGSTWISSIHRSTDGRSWQKISSPALEELRDVAHGAGVFVAVGDNGTIQRSTDAGLTWTSSIAPGAAFLEAISYGNGVFLAVGDTAVYTSPDGVTWTDRSAGTLLESWQGFNDVLHADGVFFAGGWYSGIQRSTDGGQSWSACAILGGHDYEIRSLAAGPGVLVASAVRQGSPDVTVQLVSADGLVWQESTGTITTLTDTLAYGPGHFLSTYGSDGARARSGSLITGNQAPAAAITAPATRAARATFALFATASDPDGDALTLLWDFGDGSALAEGPVATHAYASGGNYTVTLAAIDRRGGVTLATHAITVSEPLSTWTQLPSGTTTTLHDIARGGTRLVAVGAGSGTYRVSTNDGASWTGGTIGINITLHAVIHDGARFVAVGQNYDFGINNWVGEIYTSTDGAAWTLRYHGATFLRDVVYSGSRYIAVGDAGTILTSTDATTWTPVASGVSVNLNGVSHGAGVFVIAGAASNSLSPTVLTSPNGLDWTNTSAGIGTSQGLSEIEFAHDRFLVSGFFARLRHSTNAGVSFATTETLDRRAYGFARANGVFFAAAVDQNNANAPINLLSLDGATWTSLPTATYAQRNAVIADNGAFITVGANGEIWRSAVVATPGATGFAAWLLTHFPSLPAGSAPGDDFDRDGAANLVEYATGTDPRDAAERTSLQPAVIAGVLTLVVDRDAIATDVVHEFQTSTTLGSWTETGVTVSTQGNNLVAMVPLDGPRRFLRLVLTLAQ